MLAGQGCSTPRRYRGAGWLGEMSPSWPPPTRPLATRSRHRPHDAPHRLRRSGPVGLQGEQEARELRMAGVIYTNWRPLLLLAREAADRASSAVGANSAAAPSDAIVAIVMATSAAECFINEFAEVASIDHGSRRSYERWPTLCWRLKPAREALNPSSLLPPSHSPGRCSRRVPSLGGISLPSFASGMLSYISGRWRPSATRSPRGRVSRDGARQSLPADGL